MSFTHFWYYLASLRPLKIYRLLTVNFCPLLFPNIWLLFSLIFWVLWGFLSSCFHKWFLEPMFLSLYSYLFPSSHLHITLYRYEEGSGILQSNPLSHPIQFRPQKPSEASLLSKQPRNLVQLPRPSIICLQTFFLLISTSLLHDLSAPTRLVYILSLENISWGAPVP